MRTRPIGSNRHGDACGVRTLRRAWRPRSSRPGVALGAAAAACLLAGWIGLAGAPAPLQDAVQRGLAPATTTAADQIDLALTVYNSELALVRDRRDIALPEGAFDLQFVDVAASINPSTVRFRSLTAPDAVSVLEQNYEYDLLDPEKLLRKYVGRTVTLVRDRQADGTARREEIEAELLALNNGPVWRIGTGIVTGLQADHYRFPSLPQNLYSHPTLVWRLQSADARPHRVEASYLTGGIGWTADYVLTVERNAAAADLDGWVTLTNQSGATFGNATLQLVAGDLNRVESEPDLRVLARRAAAEAAAPQAMTEETFAEYHLYRLPRRTAIRDRETKQVSLLSGHGVPIQKTFVVEGRAHYYRNRQHPGAPLKDPVRTYYAFRNDAASGLGMPLPAGTVRVYQLDSGGHTQFAGEDRIAHTPKNETLRLRIGNAFDVVAERRQTDFQKIADSVYESAFEIRLRNHKPEAVTVEVHEPIGGTWQIVRSSHEPTKTSAWSARFDVAVEAEGETVLSYRVRVRS